MTDKMTVTLNGDPKDLEAGSRVADLVAALGHDPSRPGVAVAVNGEVVRRGCWADHPLEDGDRVELVGAVQGG